jgi:hypothetical protein
MSTVLFTDEQVLAFIQFCGVNFNLCPLSCSLTNRALLFGSSLVLAFIQSKAFTRFSIMVVSQEKMWKIAMPHKIRLRVAVLPDEFLTRDNLAIVKLLLITHVCCVPSVWIVYFLM